MSQVVRSSALRRWQGTSPQPQGSCIAYERLKCRSWSAARSSPISATNDQALGYCLMIMHWVVGNSINPSGLSARNSL
jgi:hypothetical protein